ncbi:MAG: hypothetical protein F6J98_34730 [Moorea sp. SIO4G2]|nr:hypothetical protein [Moorena sp. SIO4G2]
MHKTNFKGYHRYDTYCPPYINLLPTLHQLLPTPYSLMIKIAQDRY